MGDPRGDASKSSTHIRCPHCNQFIDLEEFKGLFFDEYLNRLPKKELGKLLADFLPEIKEGGGLDKEGIASVGGENKGGGHPENKEVGKPQKKEGLFTLEEFLEQVRDMKYHQPLYKGLRDILKAQGHWRRPAPGGAFKKGNPYRFKQ